MIGGAISGYCAIGSRKNDTAPSSTKTIAITAAKIGRSMKKCEMRICRRLRWPSLAACPARRAHWRARGLTLLPGWIFAMPLTTTRSSGLRPSLIDAQTLIQRPERHISLGCHVIGIDDIDELAHLLGADRGIGHQQRLIRRRGGHPHPREHSGHEQAVGIGEHGTAADGAGRAVDDVVDEIHPSVVAEVLLVDQLQVHRRRGAAAGNVAGSLAISRLRHPLVAQESGLIEGEFETDRIGRDDGREQRGVADRCRRSLGCRAKRDGRRCGRRSANAAR